jgi:hypothetical protein
VQHVGVGEHNVGVLADIRARLARGVAVVGYRYSARARACWERMCSVGRLKHMDLPEAVPVVTMVGPSAAA